MPMRMSCYYMQTVTVLVYHSVLVQVTLDFELELGVPDFQIDYTVDFIAPNRIQNRTLSENKSRKSAKAKRTVSNSSRIARLFYAIVNYFVRREMYSLPERDLVL